MYGASKSKRIRPLLPFRSFHEYYTDFILEKAGKMSPSPSTNSGVANATCTSNFYYPGLESPSLETDGTNLQCPVHTTEWKLIAKIDLRVVPLLCLLYLLTFLDRYVMP